MRILASPARRNRAANPFNFLLSEALAAQGCEVEDLDGDTFPRWDVLRLHGRWDVFHIHWPQSYAQSVKGVIILVARLSIQRLKRARIVWTVHNVFDHDRLHPALERTLMWLVVRLVHGVIFLTASSRVIAYREMPGLKAKPFAIIPHGLYGQRSEKTRDQTRTMFGLPRDGPVIGFLGDIRRYKGLDHLLKGFGNTTSGQITLFVVGAFQESAYGTEIRACVSALSAAGHSIVFREERVDHATLVDAVRACDLIVLPYIASWNSGLAILILENGGRILTSNSAVFRELQDELGPDWVEIFDGSLTGHRLLTALNRSAIGEGDRREAFCAIRSWSHIGQATMAFYKRLGARPR
jgi:beta-1,4-mannosyltransferase